MSRHFPTKILMSKKNQMVRVNTICIIFHREKNLFVFTEFEDVGMEEDEVSRFGSQEQIWKPVDEEQEDEVVFEQQDYEEEEDENEPQIQGT